MSEITLDQHIAIDPKIAGGKPHISGHRITVQNIVVWHERMALSADEIASEHGLTLSDIYAAIAYYFDHREKIDKDIDSDTELIKLLRQQTPSKLGQKPTAI